MSRFCPQCGNEISDDSAFCGECGYSVGIYNGGTDKNLPHVQVDYQQRTNQSYSYANQGYNNSSIGKSEKSKGVAAVLAFFLGGLGIHRFYLGYVPSGVVMLLLTIVVAPFLYVVVVGVFVNIIVGIWALIDFILILTGGMKDSLGRDLT